MRTKRRRRNDASAAADLTPMIDVVFQLLIFFILCTRFRVEEPNFKVELPKTDGLSTDHSVPKEALTIYCQWDDELGAHSYVIGIEARGRVAVPGSFARLEDLVIYARDNNATVTRKKAAYRVMHEALVESIKSYITRSGARIEKFEISFAKDPVAGAGSGTAPWLFVSGALDAVAAINEPLVEQGLDAFPVNFKFTDALGRYR